MTIVFRAEIHCDGATALTRASRDCQGTVSSGQVSFLTAKGLTVLENAVARKNRWRQARNPAKTGNWHLCKSCAAEYEVAQYARKAARDFHYDEKGIGK